VTAVTAAPAATPTLRRRTLLTSGALGALAALAGPVPGRARAAAQPFTPVLPPPTGPAPVGAVPLHLVDTSRRDPWDPAIPVRELMVTVFYPARTVAGLPPVAQMTPGAAASFGVLAPLVHPGLPASGVDWAATLTHAHAGAPAAPGRRPVLLYSPGGGDPRTLGTAVAEELASHGSVVVTVDHPGDATEVEFPTATEYRGLVRWTAFRGDPRADPAVWRTMVETRVADLRFLLDALHDAVPPRLRGLLDLRRAGVYGHSAGGTAAAVAMAADRRFRAAVNLEGYLDDPAGELLPVAARGTDRPLSLVTTGAFPDMGRAWAALLARSRGRACVRHVESAAHWVFCDYAAIAPQLETAGLMTAPSRAALVGTLPPARSVPLVRNHVRRFFDHH
jgi:dienelactone hydrolase